MFCTVLRKLNVFDDNQLNLFVCVSDLTLTFPKPNTSAQCKMPTGKRQFVVGSTKNRISSALMREFDGWRKLDQKKSSTTRGVCGKNETNKNKCVAAKKNAAHRIQFVWTLNFVDSCQQHSRLIDPGATSTPLSFAYFLKADFVLSLFSTQSLGPKIRQFRKKNVCNVSLFLLFLSIDNDKWNGNSEVSLFHCDVCRRQNKNSARSQCTFHVGAACALKHAENKFRR